MGHFRSETIYLYKFIFHKDNELQVIKDLAKLELIHLLDLNKHVFGTKLKYYDIVSRCTELGGKIK